jgi:hypothetical protein
MKKTIWIATLIIAAAVSGFAQNQDVYHDNTYTDDVYYNDNTYNQDNDGMSYQTFYDQLSPYGVWIDYPGYGYAWVPQVSEGFSPYMTDGHWVYTDMGWTWASDYAWGWAAFHYGRWFRDPDYGGWLWIPGYDWAPAWVTWGIYDDYYCWAPIGPRGYVNSRYGDRYDRHWYCLPRGRMGDEGMGRYIVRNTVVNHDRNDFERNVHIINNTHTYNRSVFNSGPKAEEVRAVVGHDIRPVRVANTNAPGRTEVHDNQISIYRPAISRNNATLQQAVPTKVVRPDEIRTNIRNNTPGNHDAQPANIEPRNNNGGQHDAQPRNNAPVRSEPQVQPRTSPIRENNGWTPPRQSAPIQSEPRQNYQQPRQVQPMQQSRPSGGFIPAERQQAPMRSAPAPSFRAPSGGGRH